MTALTVQNPLSTFTGTDGAPLQTGYVYLGSVNQNPISSPVAAYFDQALTIPAAQPLRTTAGYIWRNGAPAQLWTDGDCSMLVLDSKGRQVFYMPKLQRGDVSTFMAGVLAATTAAAARTALGFTATVIDRAYAEYTSNANLSTLIPLDDTVPQNTEGTQIISIAFTPKSVTSRLRLRFQGQVAFSAVPNNGIVALFSSASASAIAAEHVSVGSIDFGAPLVCEKEFVPGAVTPLTITARVGPSSAANMRMNGNSSGRYFGGSAAATLVIEELA